MAAGAVDARGVARLAAPDVLRRPQPQAPPQQLAPKDLLDVGVDDAKVDREREHRPHGPDAERVQRPPQLRLVDADVLVEGV